MFDTGDDILIPDEKTLGRILQEQDLDTKLMIAVGPVYSMIRSNL